MEAEEMPEDAAEVYDPPVVVASVAIEELLVDGVQSGVPSGTA
jgi:hypothetical protein